MSARAIAAGSSWSADSSQQHSSVRRDESAKDGQQGAPTLPSYFGASRYRSTATASLCPSIYGKAPTKAQARSLTHKQNANLAHAQRQGLHSQLGLYTNQPRAQTSQKGSHDDTQVTEVGASRQPRSDHDSGHQLPNRTQQQIKGLGLEGVAYAADLLLKLKHPESNSMMPLSSVNDHAFHAGTGIARKRGLPYARSDVDLNQAPLGPSNGNFYISAPRPARLFPTPMHEFRKGKYATTGGDRGFMTVFEYDVRGHTMMIDVDTSFVRFTSITQAIGKNKVNFGRLVRACPALDPHITKLKGGYLSIQGTWLPYDLAKELSRRIAWEIRDHLVPLFGYDFPSTCLRPDSEGFGQLAIGMSQKRARKRHNNGGPHQTSCYGPSLPISVVGGQPIEHVPASKSQPYQSSQPATLYYSKGYGMEGRQWYGQDYLAPTGNLDNMVWPSTVSSGSGLQVPLTSTPSLTGLGANGGSPILSSPPSSNASSSSNQSYAAGGYSLMVPPTVPSHSMPGESVVTQTEGSTSTESSRGCGGLTNHGYAATYADANAQLSAWSDSTHTSAYVSSSPTPPPPAPHASSSSFQFDPWQQSTPSA